MLDAAVLLEVEDRATDVVAEVKVEGCSDDLVVLAERAGGDLAGRRNNCRAADQADSSSLPALAAASTQAPF
jgi:hypothetical protein